MTTKVAIIGSGNIGTDLMMKVVRLSGPLEVAAMAGIDPESDGLARARRLGIATTDQGAAGLAGLPDFDDVRIVFDATSARAHADNDTAVRAPGRRIVDLTPAAVGPYVVPPVNLDALRDEPNLNMVTCGGQATIPIVAAVAAETEVRYAEIVAAISSRSAGVGTRANIDEFTRTTRAGVERIGGAARAKAVIILNPADPPLIMRDTVHCLVPAADSALRRRIHESVTAMVSRVADYVPGYRLKQDVQFSPAPAQDRAALAHTAEELTQVSAFLEVEGAAHYLPAYAGNLDIMTSAALQVGERLALRPGAPEVSR